MVLVACGSGIGVQASETDANANNFWWSKNDDGTITITGYKGTNETVVIPSEIDGKKVTVIGERAFYEHKNLKHVIISEGVTTIGDWAFESCENLENIQFPEGLKIIKMCAFINCYNLQYINLPNTLEDIGTWAFNSSKLEKIKIPYKVTELADDAFNRCYNLTEVEFDNGIKNINLNAFELVRLTKVYIPDSVKSIRGFFQCDINYKLKIYANPNSYARTYANQMGIKFSCLNTHDWDKGTITTKATAIKDGIKTYTCTACKKTKTQKITKLGLPKKGKSITESRSKNTYKVTKSSAKNGTVELTKADKSKNTITIPDTVVIDGVTYKVTSVSKNVFKNNKKLKKVTIGKNITKINENTFYGCKNLKSITIKSTNVKSVGKNAFKGIHSKAKIKVPKSKFTKYKKMFAKKGQKSTVNVVK